MTRPFRPESVRLGRPAALLLATAVLLAAAPPATAGLPELKRHVEYLASPALEGRLTGTEGARQAAAYLAAELEKLGAVPLPGQENLEMPFEFTAGSKDAGSSLSLAGAEQARRWTGERLVQALSFSDSGTVEGEVVFAGYGMVVPETQGFAYDSYAGLDVDGKIVLVLRYFPEDTEGDMRAQLARYSGLRYKALQARQRGAAALLVVTGPRSPNAGETIAMSFDTAISGSGLIAASIAGEVAAALFQGRERDLEATQKSLDDGNPHVVGFPLGLELSLDVAVERERKTGYNVVGMLPPNLDPEVAPEKPYVILGAHYDHLGRGGGGNSLARKDEAGQIHHGADDNASGVAALLEAAARLAGAERVRTVVLALWTGEEIGLLGSTAFLKDEVLDPASIAAYVNLDMVGRMRDNRLSIPAAGSSSAWPALIERVNVPVGFDVETGEDPYLPTDSTVFNQAEIPTLYFFTGGHEDYHRPTDMADKINYEDLERVARFGALLVGRLADQAPPPDFVKVEPTAGQGGASRDTARAFTGTIPDYTTEVEGLRLSGVIAGGPADEAGLKEGDVIVQLGEVTVGNIYDYTYALDAVKIDQPTKVVYLRDGERREAEIVPRTRD